jgi:hypothetical protein
MAVSRKFTRITLSEINPLSQRDALHRNYEYKVVNSLTRRQAAGHHIFGRSKTVNRTPLVASASGYRPIVSYNC